VISSIFLVATSICFFFPTSFDENMQQTAEDFNYTIVVFGGALLIAATYWFLPKGCGGARHFFTGPVRPEDVIDGEFKEKKLVQLVSSRDKTSTIAAVGPSQDGKVIMGTASDVEIEENPKKLIPDINNPILIQDAPI
jgi:hypothetical protein